MKQPLPDEFLSAYLDGELTPEQRVEVERALAEDAQQRRLFEELQAVRGRLEALPVQQPPGALAERILRRAEEIARERNGAARSGPPPVKASGRQAGGGGGGSSLPWRRLAVASAALAASLLVIVMVLNNRPRELAVRDQAPAPASAPAAPRSPSEDARSLFENRGETTRPMEMEMAAGDAFAPAPEEPVAEETAPARDATSDFEGKGGYRRRGGDRAEGQAIEPTDKAFTDKAPADELNTKRGLAVTRRRTGTHPELQQEAPGKAGALERGDAKRAAGEMGRPSRQQGVANGTEEGRRFDFAPSSAAMSAPAGQAGATGLPLGLQYLAENGNRMQQADALFEQIAADDVYVIPLDVEPVALQPSNVNRVFLRNSIDVTELSGQDSMAALDSLNRDAGSERATTARAPEDARESRSLERDPPPADRPGAEVEEPRREQEVQARAQQAVESIERQIAGGAQTNLYYVEASPQQLQGLLRDFAQRPGLVRSFNNVAPLKNYYRFQGGLGVADGATPYFGGAAPFGAAGAPEAAGFGGGGGKLAAGGEPPSSLSRKAPKTESPSGSPRNVPAAPTQRAGQAAQPAGQAAQPGTEAAQAVPAATRPAGGRRALPDEPPQRGQALQIPSDSLQARARGKVLSSVAELGDAAEKVQGERGARSQPESYRVLLILQAAPNPPAPPLGDRQQVPRQHATEESNGGRQDPPSRRRAPRD